ncbi:MAG TPA: threonine--tRNA ligase [Sphaerochaeta sp.]|nr:MAG: threonine--tRNA ligase [Spirochaetes bacterium GWC2_52_13]OHD62261.1 MAG: threonine--tRNA ligase [Spirochaetes bacterium GWF2_52_7]HCG64733.1 threonine--tRNA ligase [Sphaerochaeta sp.]HCS35931.1 threonine--tRNA ligase [Sphaerochaeta sp.]
MAGKELMDEKLSKVRHSMSHVMAEAVLQMFPTAQIAIGPAIDNGFYYDFDLPRTLTADDLDEISDRMKLIIKEDKEFKRIVVSRDEAKKLFADQIYKQELIDAIPADEEVSLYNQGGFTDLCRGPHVASTKELNPEAFKLLNTAGAYWRGKETNPMLTRIYATAWTNPKDLRLYLQKLEEIEKRDHRKLGKELDLFSFHEEAGPGLVYWHPRGARIRMAIENFWKDQHYANGYEMVYTPHVGKAWLWETSGHLGFYKESMYSSMEMDKADYYAKPMNCPFHIMIYRNSKHSYRELPFRWAELGTVYRYEKAGALHGLMRVRGFTQDDAHIFCTPEQMDEEIKEVLRFSLAMLRSFGFEEIGAYLSTRPEKSVGEPERWDAATESLRKAIEAEGLEYGVDEGGGAFYGPKIDLKIKDALGREWQLSTIQFDFNEPERFNMTFVDTDGVEKRPYMIHRALLGSIERFFGVLLEHFAGAFPLWLAAEQVCVVPVSEVFNDYGRKVLDALKKQGIRAYLDDSDDRMNAKIRNAQKMKVPHMLVLGEREEEQGAVSVRYRDGKQENGIALDSYIAMLHERIASKQAL